MDGYRNQPSRVAFAGVTLTGTAADNQYVFDTAGMTNLSLDVDYAGANSIQFTLEHSPDGGENWYSLVIDNTSTTSVLTPRVWEFAGPEKLNVVVSIAYKQMRMSLSETGLAGSVASVDYTLSGV